MCRKKILININQGLDKYKTKILIKGHTIYDFNLLVFLWQNGFIYGFSSVKTEKNNLLVIFLKYNKLGNKLLFTCLNKTVRKHNLLMEKKWNKNSFFILKTKNGFSNQTKYLKKQIGGFLLSKLF